MNNPKSVGSDNNLYLKFQKQESDANQSHVNKSASNTQSRQNSYNGELSNLRGRNNPAKPHGHDIESGDVSYISYDPAFAIEEFDNGYAAKSCVPSPRARGRK